MPASLSAPVAPWNECWPSSEGVFVPVIVIASAAKQPRGKRSALGCFAALAMTDTSIEIQA